MSLKTWEHWRNCPMKNTFRCLSHFLSSVLSKQMCFCLMVSHHFLEALHSFTFFFKATFEKSCSQILKFLLLADMEASFVYFMSPVEGFTSKLSYWFFFFFCDLSLVNFSLISWVIFLISSDCLSLSCLSGFPYDCCLISFSGISLVSFMYIYFWIVIFFPCRYHVSMSWWCLHIWCNILFLQILWSSSVGKTFLFRWDVGHQLDGYFWVWLEWVPKQSWWSLCLWLMSAVSVS